MNFDLVLLLPALQNGLQPTLFNVGLYHRVQHDGQPAMSLSFYKVANAILNRIRNEYG